MKAIDDAVNAIYSGNPVNCTKKEYDSGVRKAIQDQAGKWIDEKQDIWAMIALEEVRRLDKKFQTK